MYDSKDLDIMIKFDSYIRRCIKNLSVNYDKQEKGKWYNDAIFFDNDEDFNCENINEIYKDNYLSRGKTFYVKGIPIEVNDEILADALDKLPEKQRNIILLYYFEQKTDLNIAIQLDSIRRTINYQRQIALIALKELIRKSDD